MEVDFKKITNNILKDLPERKREIIERRFGIWRENKETLQSIGNDLGITRERVRQIINATLEQIKHQHSETILQPIRYLSDYLKEHGDLKREDRLLEEVGRQKYQGCVYLFLTIGEEFQRYNEDQDVYSLWTIKEESVYFAKKVIQKVVIKLEEKKEPHPFEKLLELIEENIHQKALNSYIEVAKKIETTPEGLYGLIYWPEINPRGIRDKAYLVLKRAGRPMHFLEITQKIKELPYQRTDVSPESVHNELIRSDLFVLVGRGIYALREWGYEPGTVKDMIIKVLKEAKKPLAKEEIIQKVLEKRIVKVNTILLNLQDKTLFEKDKEGRYYISSKAEIT